MTIYVQKLVFPFSNFSLPQPNVLKLTHNAYYQKTQIKFEFWWCHFYLSRVLPLLQMEKIMNFRFLFSSFSLPKTNVMNLIHSAYYYKMQIKFEFWWEHFYCIRVMSPYKWNKLLRRAQLDTATEVQPWTVGAKMVTISHMIQVWIWIVIKHLTHNRFLTQNNWRQRIWIGYVIWIYIHF